MQVGAILEAYGVESAPHATSQSPWQSFRLSTVNELSKNQALFVFGLYLGLALPSLLHLGAAARH